MPYVSMPWKVFVYSENFEIPHHILSASHIRIHYLVRIDLHSKNVQLFSSMLCHGKKNTVPYLNSVDNRLYVIWEQK